MLPENKIENKSTPNLDKYIIKLKDGTERVVYAITINTNDLGDYVFIGLRYENLFILDSESFIYVEKVERKI